MAKIKIDKSKVRVYNIVQNETGEVYKSSDGKFEWYSWVGAVVAVIGLAFLRHDPYWANADVVLNRGI
jgi:hypothetical protein